jgi:hypothetical protein
VLASGHKHVTNIFTRPHNYQAQIVWLGCRQVFQAMHCQVDASLVQGTLDLGNKDAITAYLRERHIGHTITGGAYPLDSYL